MTIPEIEGAFVATFPDSSRRRHIMHRLEEFIQILLTSGIPCEVWLDGSFLTEKLDPSDLDVTVILEPDVTENLTQEQSDLIHKIAEGQIEDDIDSFAFTRLNRTDPGFGDEYLDPAHSWGEQYGLECSDEWLKGYVVLRLRETNVGLRIRS